MLMLALIVPALAYGVLRIEGPRIREEALANLAAIGRLKTEQIEVWLNERHGDAAMLMASEGFVDDAQSWLDRRDSVANERISRRLAALRRTHAYRDVELLDPRKPAPAMSASRKDLLAAAIASGRAQTSDLYRDPSGAIWLEFLAPLIKPTPSGRKVVGVVALRTLSSAYMFRLIQSWPTASPSAETLLVRREGDSVLFLNELRHRQGTSLSLRLPLGTQDLPAAIAIRDGRIQTLEGHDYRGTPVLAAVRPVRGTPWSLIAKVDRDEVLHPLYQLVAWVGTVAGCAMLAILFMLRRLWRQQQQSHRLELKARTVEKEQLLQLFYQLPFMGMAIVDPTSRHWLQVNDRMCEILGYSREELLTTRSCDQLTHPDDLARESVLLQQMLTGEIDDYQMEKRFQRKDDDFVDVEVSVKCVRHDDARVKYIVKTVGDITDRKRLEAAKSAQQRSANLLNAIASASTDVIFAKDRAGNYLFYNHEAARGVSREAEAVIGHDDTLLYPPAVAEYIMAVDREVIATNDPVTYEEVLTTCDGMRTFLTTKGPLRDVDGNAIGLYGISRDITERKKAERVLREREEDLNRAQIVGHIGSWRLDVRHNQLTWSDENHRIFSVAIGTPLTYETFLARVHPDDRAYVDRMWQAALRGESYNIEHRLLLDCEVKWVREKAELEFDQDGILLGGFGITQDITDIKLAERALRDSEERFQLAAEISRFGTWDWNVRSNEIIWSRGHYEILGYQVGEVPSSYQAWADRVHPDDLARIEAEIDRCMRERLDYVVEFRVVWPDASVHWMSSRGRFEYDQDGVCLRMVGALVDITSLKQAELTLREADQRKDEFLAMLAHELRNPLTPIRNAAHVLGRLDLAEPRLQWVRGIIERQVDHLTHLVDELLDVSRIARGKIALKRTRVELTELVRQTRESVASIMSAKNHRFEVRIPEEPLVLDGDLVRLVQILQNLLNNAAKYTPDGGHIELLANPRGKEIEIEVRDNGMGISASLLPAVFDLFRQGERTLDRSQGGLGIGLTLVRQLVEMHGGRVTASSPGPGLGAGFSVRLPLADAPAITSTGEARPEAVVKPGLRILVVEDDPLVAESMVMFLQMEGHQVRRAAAAAAALDVLAEFRPQVALIDIGLPGQNGYQLAENIRRREDGASPRLIAVSGYGDQEAVQRSRVAGFDQHLVKPVDPRMLCSLLTEIGRSTSASNR